MSQPCPARVLQETGAMHEKVEQTSATANNV